MKEVEFQATFYEASDSRMMQGNKSKIQQYLNDGFYVKEERNVFLVLVKPARVIVSVREIGKKSV